jgi:hypothetical protein
MVSTSKGKDPSSFLDEVIECGQRKVQRDFRVSLRDICENNNIVEGDIIIVYIKKVKK